jgi:outer membrane receptor protein involved in Fe transport
MGGKFTKVSRPIGIALAGCAALGIASEAWSQVEEIVVTTRKREESLQEVPVAVEAITAEDIEQKGITTLADVVQQSASVILDQGFAPQDQRIVIRGLSPTRGRQNVAVLVDDIDISSESVVTSGGSLLINPQLFDLERVEIVKGPQNALYGRSAFAGAINYITKKPGDVFDANIGSDIGSDGQMMLKAGVSGPLSEGINAGINAMTWNHDGFYTNSLTGGDLGGKEGNSVAGTLVWKATEALSITGRVEYLNDEFDPTPYVRADFPADQVPVPSRPQFNAAYPIPFTAFNGDQIYCNPVCPGAAGTLAPVIRTPITTTAFPGTIQDSVLGIKGELPDGDTLTPRVSEDPRTCRSSYPLSLDGCRDYAGTSREITRGTLTIDWDLGPVALKSLTHVANSETQQEEGSEDVSASEATAVGELHVKNDTDLFSQELRVISRTDGPFSWVAGALYWNEQTDVLDGSATCLDYGFLIGAPNVCGATLRNIVDTGRLTAPPGVGIPLADPTRVPLNPSAWDRETEHWSVYALVEWQFLETWNISFEGREVWEDLSIAGPGYDVDPDGPGPAPPISVGNGLFDPSGVFDARFFFPCGFSIGACPQPGPGTIDYPTVPGGALTYPTGFIEGDDDDDFFAPKATLTWTPTGDQTYYFSWAESYKPSGITPFTGGAGGFDPVANSFDQERLQVWELGAKTTWLDGALFLNAAGFYEDFKDKQVSTQILNETTGTLVPRTVNAGAAEVWGVELEMAWSVTDNFSVNLAYTWLDTEYTEYLNTTSAAGTIGYVGKCLDVIASSPTPLTSGPYVGQLPSACVLDYSGNELEGAPENTLVGGARYQNALAGETDWFVEGDFEFQDERFADDRNTMVFPDYWLANFRVGVTNEAWDVIAYVDNAFDDDTIKTGLADGDIPYFQATQSFANKGTVILPDQRQFGLRVNYRFAD